VIINGQLECKRKPTTQERSGKGKHLDAKSRASRKISWQRI
jgi:hypothetical protein